MAEITKIQEQFGKHLLTFIKSRVSSLEDAQDIYQEVIVKIINKSDQLKKAESLKSWLFTIAKNQIITYYRSRKITDDVYAVQLVDVAENKNAYGEMEGCLHGFINVLPEDYRGLIEQSEIQGKSQKELSESLGMNYVTVRSKVQRGREKIRNMIFEACSIQFDSLGGVADCSPNRQSATCGAKSNC